MRIRINHPMADTISVISGFGAYAGKNSVEIAFFKDGDFVVPPIPEFAQYHDGSTEDSAVYPYVPRELVDEFLFYHER